MDELDTVPGLGLLGASRERERRSDKADCDIPKEQGFCLLFWR